MGPDYRPDADTKAYNLSDPIGYIEQAADHDRVVKQLSRSVRVARCLWVRRVAQVPHTFGYQSGTYGVLNEHGASQKQHLVNLVLLFGSQVEIPSELFHCDA